VEAPVKIFGVKTDEKYAAQKECPKASRCLLTYPTIGTFRRMRNGPNSVLTGQVA
jgi:hypothetical protein